MRVLARADQDFYEQMAAEYLRGEKAVTGVMRRASTDLKSRWRAQVTGAGLGRKLGNTIRAAAYPKGTESMNAAALIWTKAPKLIGAHDAGPLIRSRDGFWLAIPTKAAGKGPRGRKLTPDEWERKTGRNLIYIHRRGRPPLLVDQGQRRFRSRQDSLAFTESRRNRKARQSVVIFTLVPQVKLAKRLDLDRDAQAVARAVPGQIVAAWGP